MLSVVENFKTGKLELAQVPAPICRDGFLVVANRASLISAGTERAAIEMGKKSLAGKALARPDLVRQVIKKVRRDGLKATIGAVRARLDLPVALGYSSAGVVLEVGRGVESLAPGDAVACAGAKYATHSEIVAVPKNLCARIPQGVSFEDASFATLGAIAMHGVRQASLSLGETAAVIGCGLLGLLTVQILKTAGVRVFAVDINEACLALAVSLGATAAASSRSGELPGIAAAFTGSAGFDAVLLTAATKSSDPVHLASLIARDRARIVVVGNVGMNIRRRHFYDKELTLVMSRSYGPGRYDPAYEERGVEYPLGYVRWGEKRNLEEFLRLVGEGQMDVTALTTHTFAIGDALDAYDLVLGKKVEPYIGIVLSYPQTTPHTDKIQLHRKAEPTGAKKIAVGFIGAGSFAQGVLLPALAGIPSASPVGIASAGGLSAEHAGRKFGFAYAASDASQILADDSVNAVVIATRHNLHASQTARALKAAKNVYVEKPLALTREELEEVRSAYLASDRILMVGYNRRFSPHAAAARRLFAGRKRPLTINYRVNAGVVPQESWVQDTAEGGGRVLGEVCHFVDLSLFFAGALPVTVFAARASGADRLPEDSDNVAVHVTFADGSIAVILYVSSGDDSLPKERIEVAGASRTAVIEDFRRTHLYEASRRRTVKTAQDKGHAAALDAFFKGVMAGRAPIAFEELYASTLATIAVEESLATGQPVKLGL